MSCSHSHCCSLSTERSSRARGAAVTPRRLGEKVSLRGPRAASRVMEEVVLCRGATGTGAATWTRRGSRREIKLCPCRRRCHPSGCGPVTLGFSCVRFGERILWWLPPGRSAWQKRAGVVLAFGATMTAVPAQYPPGGQLSVWKPKPSNTARPP